MLSRIIEISLFIISFVCFLYFFNNLKQYFKVFLILSIIVLILYVIDLSILFYTTNLQIDYEILGHISYNILKIFIFGTTGLFLLKKYNISDFLILKNILKNKEELSHNFLIILTAILILLIITSIYLFTKEKNIFEKKSIDILTALHLFIFTLILAVQEEAVFRMFLQSLFYPVFQKIDLRFAILFSSLFFTLSHEFIDVFRFIQLLIIGITLGYLMYKQGFESAVLAHFLFNIFNILIFKGVSN